MTSIYAVFIFHYVAGSGILFLFLFTAKQRRQPQKLLPDSVKMKLELSVLRLTRHFNLVATAILHFVRIFAENIVYDEFYRRLNAPHILPHHC